MKVTPPSAARSRTDVAAASSICRPKVIVPRQSRETFRPVRPSRVCWMSTLPGLVHSDVVGGRDHLDTVDEPLEHVALNSRLHHVPVLNTVLRADELLQRGEVPNLPIPTHDFRVSLVSIETPEEHLVPGAEMWRDRTAQPYLDLLEVLGRRVLAENRALRVLVLPPGARQHRGRIVVVPFGDGALTARRIEIALLDAPLRDSHTRHRSVGETVLRKDVGPVDPISLAVDP